ncbi:MAG: hypothetical protein IID41_05820 [Planctomycetes bacterium]|nr:hypothetical protein [Planctomycetota bacterium]
MKRAPLKACLLAVVVGNLFQIGCLSNGFFRSVAVEVAAEQVAGSIPLPSFGGLLGGGNGG